MAPLYININKFERESMNNKLGLTEEAFESCLKTIVDKKNGMNDYDWQEIIDMYDLPLQADALRKSQATPFGGSAVYEYITERHNRNKSTDQKKKDFGENICLNRDGSYSSTRLIELNTLELKDPDVVLRAHGFDPEAWEIVSAKNNLRETGKRSLYASYVTARPRKSDGDIPFSKIKEQFDSLDRHYHGPSKEEKDIFSVNTKKNSIGGKMLLLNIADLHMNLQSTLLSTGNEYNCDIAERLFFNVITDVLKRCDIYSFEKIIFCIGGDMLNGDGLSGSTTKGTPQESDTHYYDAYERLCSMTVKAIDVLKDYAEVEVIYVPGNHDEQTGFKLAMFVDAWFRNDNSVHVDYSPLPRKYTVFGSTLLCFTHDGNMKTLPALIADEAREYWSNVKMTEVFLQHLHSEQILLEENNLRIQRLPTISAKSKWANDSGFNSKRQCKSFVFDKDDGLTDVIYTYVKEDK